MMYIESIDYNLTSLIQHLFIRHPLYYDTFLHDKFLLENSLLFGDNKIISFQKLAGNLDKMIVANLGRQHHRSLNSYFRSARA